MYVFVDRHPRELGLVLEQEAHLVPARGLLHGHRRDQVAAVLLDLRGDVGERHAEDPRQPSELGVLDVRGRDPHRRRARVLDQHAAVAVLHGAARSLLRIQPELVVLRRDQELVPREHLERPEADEEDGERGEHEEAEDPDPEDELRRQPVGSVDASGPAAGSARVGAGRAG